MYTEEFELLTTNSKRQIAYVKNYFQGQKKNRPGILFLGGFRSDMKGTKATFLEKWCFENRVNFLKFDYSGHGNSSGIFENGCISDWKSDACEVFDKLTEGPQILVGSSMGGWISFLIGKLRSNRCRAIIGIAAAPDFTETGFWTNFTQKQKSALLRDGFVEVPSDYSVEPYIITKKLVDDGRENLIMDKPLKLSFPIVLFQGMADTEVHFSEAIKIANNLTNPDVKVILIKDADHQFSSPNCLVQITQSISEFLF